MDRYTHMHKDDMADALDALPDLSAPQQQIKRATGTADASPEKMSPRMSPNSGIKGNLAHSGAFNPAGVEHGGNIGDTAQIDGVSAVKTPVGPLGGIGRRDGFKIHFPKGVSVQVR